MALPSSFTKTEIGTATGTAPADLAAMTVAQASDMVYDADGRKLRDTLASGGTAYAVSQYSYDAAGRLTCAAQRMNPDYGDRITVDYGDSALIWITVT